MQIKLRKATIDDGERLLAWRNDVETRQNSLNTKTVSREEHFHWLEGVLTDPHRDLYIAEVDGVPAGTLRIDRDAPCGSELSWTISPEMRGKGVGKALLIEARRMLDGTLVAQIKEDNQASVKIAEAAGFILFENKQGVLLFRSATK